METKLNLTPLKSNIFSYGKMRSQAELAPSGSEPLTVSPRQTAALLPTDLQPTQGLEVAPGQEPEQQDVTEKKQEQTRLAEEARQLAEKANAYMRQADTHLEFSVSEQTGRIVISVVESDTKEVVRQIPPESLNRFANRITQMRGLLFETTG